MEEKPEVIQVAGWMKLLEYSAGSEPNELFSLLTAVTAGVRAAGPYWRRVDARTFRMLF